MSGAIRLADSAPAPAQRPLLIDADGVAMLLDLSARTIRRLNSAGRLPKPVKVGGSVRWRVDEVRRWVEGGCLPRTEWERLQRQA